MQSPVASSNIFLLGERGEVPSTNTPYPGLIPPFGTPLTFRGAVYHGRVEHGCGLGVAGVLCLKEVLAESMLGFHVFSLHVAAAIIIYDGGDWSLDKTPMADVVWACHGD